MCNSDLSTVLIYLLVRMSIYVHLDGALHGVTAQFSKTVFILGTFEGCLFLKRLTKLCQSKLYILLRDHKY